MAYPSQSTGMSGDRASLWWFTRYDGVNHLCASQGRTVLQNLQRTLRSNLPPVFVHSGVVGRRTDISVDQQFGPHSLVALGRFLEDLDTPTEIMQAVDADITSLARRLRTTDATFTPIRKGTMAAAIWVSAHRRLPFSAISMPGDTQTFRWLTDVPADGAYAGETRCVAEETITDEAIASPMPTEQPAPAPRREIPVVDINVEPFVPEQASGESVLGNPLAWVMLGVAVLVDINRKQPYTRSIR